MSDALLAIGIFGLLFTCGLFAYELFGIKKCHYLIVAGQRLETAMQVPGQFRSRPRDLAGFINEPFASAIIYPASMAAWVFLALALKWSGLAAGVVAVAVFFAGLKATRYGARRIKENQEREDRILKLVLKAEEMGEEITLDDMRKELGEEHDCVEPRVPWLDKARAALGREPDWVKRTVHRLREQGELEEERKGQEGQEQAGPLRLAKDAAFWVTSGRSAEEDREGRREAAGPAAG
jgi:hypothetical protein